MYSFYVNGKQYEAEQDQKLLPFLRDVCHLTSVKDGCSEGACGTCHVLIDGKATKACVPKLSRLEGKHVVTVEGLDEREKEIFVRAFIAVVLYCIKIIYIPIIAKEIFQPLFTCKRTT